MRQKWFDFRLRWWRKYRNLRFRNTEDLYSPYTWDVKLLQYVLFPIRMIAFRCMNDSYVMPFTHDVDAYKIEGLYISGVLIDRLRHLQETDEITICCKTDRLYIVKKH